MIGPTLEEVLDQVVTSRLQSVYTSLPGRVLAFNPLSSTCTVQPFPAIYQDGEAVDLPVLHGVPVGFPSGGGASITYPLTSGDVVLLVFASAPLGRYREDGAEGDPSDVRRFDLSDAWALPLAGGGQPAATIDRLTIEQPTGTFGIGKVQVGVLSIAPPATLIDMINGPIVPPGKMQLPGRAARCGDTVKVVLDEAAIISLIAQIAAIAAGLPVTSIEIPGIIASGSDFVEVA